MIPAVTIQVVFFGSSDLSRTLFVLLTMFSLLTNGISPIKTVQPKEKVTDEGR